MILMSLLVASFVFLVLGLFRAQVKATQLAQLSWDDLVATLEPVETDGIVVLACDHLHPGNSQLAIELDDMWSMIGGVEGLARMRANADVLIALAAHAQQWNLDQGVNVAGRMRQDGLALRRAVVGVGLGMTCGYGKRRVPFYLHEAASAYYLMRLRLLSLYEASNSARYPALTAAL